VTETQQLPHRPSASAGDVEDATRVVASFVRDLEDGRDRQDAAVADRRFAADVAWGSPFGATVHGFETLLPIHERLRRQGTGGPSYRYEIDRVLPLGQDVVVAHVARRVLGPGGDPVPPSSDPEGAFSEMALYVLVRRDGEWWLAAGQNTPINEQVHSHRQDEGQAGLAGQQPAGVTLGRLRR
jgi:uncharacterized protein (TIGR02246 family)